MKEMHLVIVSPERMLFDGKVSQVTLPGEMGEFQVLTNHAPIISSLVETQSLQIAGGFADINNNQISVCVEL